MTPTDGQEAEMAPKQQSSIRAFPSLTCLVPPFFPFLSPLHIYNIPNRSFPHGRHPQSQTQGIMHLLIFSVGKRNSTYSWLASITRTLFNSIALPEDLLCTQVSARGYGRDKLNKSPPGPCPDRDYWELTHGEIRTKSYSQQDLGMKGVCQSNGHLEQGSDDWKPRDKKQGETDEDPAGESWGTGGGGGGGGGRALCSPDVWFGNPIFSSSFIPLP